MTFEKTELEVWFEECPDPALEQFKCGRYSKQLAAEIAHKNGFASIELLDTFWMLLETSGKQFQNQLWFDGLHHLNRKERSELEAAFKHVRGLEQLLERWQSRQHSPNWKSLQTQQFRWTPLEAQEYSHLLTDDWVANLKHIRETIEIVRANRPSEKKGRPAKYALHMWALRIKRFWVDDLNRAATYQMVEGVPASAFCQFGFECFEPLKPDLKNSKSKASLATALKKVTGKK